MTRTSTGRFSGAAAACLLVLGSFNAGAAPIAPTGLDGGIIASGRLIGLRAALTANADALAALARGDLAAARREVARTLGILREVKAECASDAGLAKLGAFVGEIIGTLESGFPAEADLERVEQDLATALTFAR
ncbi:hypothetical protein ACPZ19_43915 [Amycolatopsis lurida]